jgi:alpha-tubulin suppressor-like RCC1 family protein
VWQLPHKARFIAAGGGMNAAILEDDSLVTWGMGHVGELARSANMTTLTTTTKIGDEDHVVPRVGKKFYQNLETGQYKREVIREKFLNQILSCGKIRPSNDV